MVEGSAFLTHEQLKALILTERVNSTISIISIIFVVATYIFAPGFNKPINRLVFFASFGNLGSNVAALISEAGTLAGSAAPICRFQAFLLQMFSGVDCYWALCMAVNVYLVIFRAYTVDQLRSLDISYLLICYGLSFIPAFAFIFINTRAHGPIYGPATIWCWIRIEWDSLRLVFLYAIVWVAILLALIIYGGAAKVIWDKREHLDGFLNPLNEHPFINTITREVMITSEERPIVDKAEHEIRTLEESATPDILNPYSVDIQVNTQTNSKRHLPPALHMRSLTRQIAKRENNAEAWLYARAAFLFFLALLVTWVPGSANRIYASIKPDSTNFGLNYAASFVFPLQAFWNAIVYILTSQSAFRGLLSHLPFIGRGFTSSTPSFLSSPPLSSSSSKKNSSRKHTPSPSPSQIKLTKLRGSYHQKDDMGKPRRLRSNEQISGSSMAHFLTATENGEERDLQSLDKARWSIESAHGNKFGG